MDSDVKIFLSLFAGGRRMRSVIFGGGKFPQSEARSRYNIINLEYQTRMMQITSLNGKKVILAVAMVLMAAMTQNVAMAQNKVRIVTAKTAGEKVVWEISAKGEVAFDGVTKGVPSSSVNPNEYSYTIDKQEITITGELTTLRCNSSGITSIDLKDCPSLVVLACSNNGLKELDVTKLTGLKELSCHTNKIEALDLSKSESLEELLCQDNLIETLDFTNCLKLNGANCYDNKLTSIKTVPTSKLGRSRGHVRIHRNNLSKEVLTEFVNALPERSTNHFARLYIVDSADQNEKNELIQEHINTAVGKNWRVLDFKGGANFGMGVDLLPKDVANQSVEGLRVQVYPNPAVDCVRVEGAEPNTLVDFYSMDGRLVLTSRTNAEGYAYIALNSLAEGNYLLVVGTHSQMLMLAK